MVIEISVAAIALAVVVLVIFLIVTLLKTQKTLESTRRDIHHVTSEAVELMHRLDSLTSDLKSKADSLNFVFQPLKSLNREKSHREDMLGDVMDWISSSMVLYDKIKTVVKRYAK